MDSALEQMAAVGGILLAGVVLGWAVFAVLRGASRATRRSISQARGADRPEWVSGIWQCASCLTTNREAATRCEKCRRPREELVHEPVEPRPDWIPDRIPADSGAIVTLIHDPGAHLDPGEAHWRLTIGGRTAGSAASRVGALALLRALEGPRTVALDVRGTGPSTYRLSDVIERFEAVAFPLNVPCPERPG
jgi:hypothetical protein